MIYFQRILWVGTGITECNDFDIYSSSMKSTVVSSRHHLYPPFEVFNINESIPLDPDSQSWLLSHVLSSHRESNQEALVFVGHLLIHQSHPWDRNATPTWIAKSHQGPDRILNFFLFSSTLNVLHAMKSWCILVDCYSLPVHTTNRDESWCTY